ncbi:hypothetical protein H6P81_015629 [Aristolochia fimbriata]|uniref:DUF676 domain-containing protein n=1 Tax=Aristolochia fimbriata TaxID=158543 RepID=A0AAV7E6A1_ARIFI|nr:hypothetical protein H6P81_015629 [Aristolochia fimbriata]
MFRRLRCFVGLKTASSKRLLNAKPRRLRGRSAMLDVVQEIAIYIHRFHNLDLFQQGWYQIKISMRWEDSSCGPPGTPARVVQYDAPDLGSDGVTGIWRIDDLDHSFTSQPFKIRYARQDVLLSLMVAFNFSLGKYEMPPTTAVILKFELLYAPLLENGPSLQASLDTFPTAVHEFRIPPKALSGLHSYCPLHFDSFHAVLVDLSVHIVLLKAGTYTHGENIPSNSVGVGGAAGEYYDEHNQVKGDEPNAEKAMKYVKALSSAREILVEELQKLTKAIGQPLEDFSDSSFGEKLLTGSPLKSDPGAGRDETSEIKITDELLESDLVHGLVKSCTISKLISEGQLSTLSNEELLDAFLSLGNQLQFLWNVFLKYHRANGKKILEYLRNVWANDRRAEWSIWMVHSKIEKPSLFLGSGADETTHRNVLGRASNTRRYSWYLDDAAQSSSSRAELHRRSIAQMKINNRAIQDLHIFGDPLQIPVVIVEQQILNHSLEAAGNSSITETLELKDTSPGSARASFKNGPKILGHCTQRNGRIFRVVVFVHGFQGHHLDLRLVRNQWLLIDPGAECLMSESNEDKTSGDFREMGGRLAEEVVSFLKRKIDKASRFGGYRDIKLSFVGHSIGNVIIRSSLADRVMEPYLKYLHTYMSLSGPHLGYLYSNNSLFNSGLWLLKKLKGPQCIHQLTMTDDPDLQNTFFYKLCKQKTLDCFKNMILLSSPQDGYVPYHSARIELCPVAAMDSSKKGQVFTEMLNNCMDQIRSPSLDERRFMRCDVNFDTSSHGRNLNTFIGRAAHIEFLETDIFAKFIMWSFSDLFL